MTYEYANQCLPVAVSRCVFTFTLLSSECSPAFIFIPGTWYTYVCAIHVLPFLVVPCIHRYHMHVYTRTYKLCFTYYTWYVHMYHSNSSPSNKFRACHPHRLILLQYFRWSSLLARHGSCSQYGLSRHCPGAHQAKSASETLHTAHTTAADAVDPKQVYLLVYYGRRDRSWWRASCFLFSGALLAQCAPKQCLERS